MSAEDTRRELLSAAEVLFATRGIEGPSLREISKAAGQLNTNALQYHFASREGVVVAILEKHARDVEARRDGLLEQSTLGAGTVLRDLAAALVLPQASKLDDADGGAEYLQIVAEVGARPEQFPDAFRIAGAAPSMQRWSRLVAPHLPPTAVGRPLHRRFAAIRFTNGELASRARERRRRDHRLFVSHLVDLTTAVLATPVSDETKRFIR